MYCLDHHAISFLEKKHLNMTAFEICFLFFKNRLINSSMVYSNQNFTDHVQSAGLAHRRDLACIRYSPLFPINDSITWILDYVITRFQSRYQTKENLLNVPLISQLDTIHMYSVMVKGRRINLLNYMAKDETFKPKELGKFIGQAGIKKSKVFFCLIPEAICATVLRYGFRLEDFKCILQPFFYTYAFAKNYITLYNDISMVMMVAKRFGASGTVAAFQISDIDTFLDRFRGYNFVNGTYEEKKMIDPKILIVQAMLQKDFLLKIRDTTMKDLPESGCIKNQDYIYGRIPSSVEMEQDGHAILNVHFDKKKMLTLLDHFIVEELNHYLTHIIKVL